MKTQLIIYGVLIIAFIAYNVTNPIDDTQIDTLINILFASTIFLYVAYLAYKVLRKMGKSEKQKP